MGFCPRQNALGGRAMQMIGMRRIHPLATVGDLTTTNQSKPILHFHILQIIFIYNPPTSTLELHSGQNHFLCCRFYKVILHFRIIHFQFPAYVHRHFGLEAPLMRIHPHNSLSFNDLHHAAHQYQHDYFVHFYLMRIQHNYQSQLFIRNMFVSWQASMIFICVISQVQNQEIVDFSYSQYVARDGGQGSDQLNLKIHPNPTLFQGYSFPESCYSGRQLSESQLQPTDTLMHLDPDSYIDGLKVEFLELLKLAEMMRKKKQNIRELSQMTHVSSNFTIIKPEDLDLLKHYESKLSKINSEIQANSALLDTLVYNTLKHSESNQFAESMLNFQIQSLNLKLKYLEDEKRKAENDQKEKPSTNFDDYFQGLKDKFNEQNSLINDLDIILRSYNQVGLLKAKINNLKGKVETIELMLEEKEGCKREVEEIKKSQKNQAQIQGLMASLREKKKDVNSNNKYCEGVAKKLEDRVRKLLKIYDYTFECASGIDELKIKKIEDNKELESAQKRLKELEDSKGIDEYKKKFEQNKRYIQQKHEEVKNFKIGKYSHSVENIDALIRKVKEELYEAKEKRANLPAKKENQEVDMGKIQEIVNKIKRLKGSYCREQDLYEIKAKQLWKEVHRYEAQIEYEGKINVLYQEEMNELRKLEIEFEGLRARILEKIK